MFLSLAFCLSGSQIVLSFYYSLYILGELTSFLVKLSLISIYSSFIHHVSEYLSR